MRYVLGFSELCRKNDGDILNTVQAAKAQTESLRHWIDTDFLDIGLIEQKFRELPCPEWFPEEWVVYAVGQPRVNGKELDVWSGDFKNEVKQLPRAELTFQGALASAAKWLGFGFFYLVAYHP